MHSKAGPRNDNTDKTSAVGIPAGTVAQQATCRARQAGLLAAARSALVLGLVQEGVQGLAQRVHNIADLHARRQQLGAFMRRMHIRAVPDHCAMPQCWSAGKVDPAADRHRPASTAEQLTLLPHTLRCSPPSWCLAWKGLLSALRQRSEPKDGCRNAVRKAGKGGTPHGARRGSGYCGRQI